MTIRGLYEIELVRILDSHIILKFDMDDIFKKYVD